MSSHFGPRLEPGLQLKIALLDGACSPLSPTLAWPGGAVPEAYCCFYRSHCPLWPLLTADGGAAAVPTQHEYRTGGISKPKGFLYPEGSSIISSCTRLNLSALACQAHHIWMDMRAGPDKFRGRPGHVEVHQLVSAAPAGEELGRYPAGLAALLNASVWPDPSAGRGPPLSCSIPVPAALCANYARPVLPRSRDGDGPRLVMSTKSAWSPLVGVW